MIAVGAVTGHFAYRYGIIFDYDMMINLLQTNMHEASTYITAKSLWQGFIFGIVPAALLLYVRIIWSQSLLRALAGRLQPSSGSG